jgi:hypothetical protein
LQEFRAKSKDTFSIIDSTGCFSGRGPSTISWLAKDVKIVEQLRQTIWFWAMEPNFSKFKSMYIQVAASKGVDLSDPNWGKMEEAKPEHRVLPQAANLGPVSEEHKNNARRLDLRWIKQHRDPEFLMVSYQSSEFATSLSHLEGGS